MNGVQIQAGSTHLSSLAAGAANGSPVERTYRHAVKELGTAQERLVEDATNHAADKVVAMDQVKVEKAASNLARAAQDLAGERAGAKKHALKDATKDVAKDAPADAPTSTEASDEASLDTYV